MGLSASQTEETDAQSLRQCGGKWANQGRDTGKNALQGFPTVSLGLNTFSVREDMWEPCSRSNITGGHLARF